MKTNHQSKSFIPHSIAALMSAAVLTLASSASASNLYDGYMNQEQLTRRVHALGDQAKCGVKVLTESREGREVHVLTLAGDVENAGDNPALLITAGLDGRHLVGTETAVRVAEQLLDEHNDLLDEVTVYVIPRVNPDAAALNLASPDTQHIGTTRAVDEDRDGRVDEDGPVDLNGDGVITMMRRANPPLVDQPVYIKDPGEPRLLKKAEAIEGEHAMYSLYTEGNDQDGDGGIAEDGLGEVDLDRNFMHLWPEYEIGSGPAQLSEPESYALAQFVLDHPNIFAAMTYGRHDNMINVPSGRGKGPMGRAPKDLDSDDVPIYKKIAEQFKEITGQKRAPQREIAGSFHAWLYAHRGLPSIATVVWGRPDVEKPDEKSKQNEKKQQKDDAEQGPPKTSVVGEWSGSLDIPEMGAIQFDLSLESAGENKIEGTLSTNMFSLPLTGEAEGNSATLTGNVGPERGITLNVSREGDTLRGTIARPNGEVTEITAQSAGAGSAAKGKGTSADEEAAAWLAYSDQKRDGAGFVEWKEFDHPTLGEVEIGGFVPGFKMNPPADELEELAEKQTAFAAALIDRRPELSIDGPHVTQLADGLYEVRLGIVNNGYLPTTTAMARQARAIKPTIVRLSTPLENIVSGSRISRTWGIDGSGNRYTRRWLLQVDGDEEIEITILNQQLGEQTITFTPDEHVEDES